MRFTHLNPCKLMLTWLLHFPSQVSNFVWHFCDMTARIFRQRLAAVAVLFSRIRTALPVRYICCFTYFPWSFQQCIVTISFFNFPHAESSRTSRRVSALNYSLDTSLSASVPHLQKFIIFIIYFACVFMPRGIRMLSIFGRPSWWRWRSLRGVVFDSSLGS